MIVADKCPSTIDLLSLQDDRLYTCRDTATINEPLDATVDIVNRVPHIV